MSEFYEIDSTKVTLKEYWWETKSPLLLIACAAKWLRIRIPSSTDDPSVDSLAEFVVADLPPAVRAKFLPLETELASLGFHSPVFHVIANAGNRTTLYWATFLHPSGRHYARIHHRVWQRANPPERGVFAFLFTEFSDGTFLVTSSAKRDMAAPPEVNVQYHPRTACARLWQLHEQRAAHELSLKIPRDVRSTSDLLASLERHHQLVRDFHLARGVFRPRNASEHASAEAYAASLAQAQQSGLEHAGAIAELERLQTQKPGWMNAIWLLVISAVAFLAAGASQWDWKFTLWLLPALFIHELGHWIAMRLFRYRNLRMFFIPFFGAAVTGQNWNVPGWKKALVSLAGPVPGIFLGAALGTAGLITSNSLLTEGAVILVFLNGFNLLPVLPLDGGHVLHATLFCRNRWLDIAFRIAAVVGLVGLSALGMGKLLFYIAIPLAIGLPLAFKLGKVTDALRTASLPPPLPGQDLIPPTTAQAIIGAVRHEVPKGAPDKVVAQHALNIFETLNAKPPGALASIGLLALHAGSFAVAITFAFLLILSKHGGGLGGFLAAAIRQPQHEVECRQVERWTGANARPGTDDVNNLIVATFEGHDEAKKTFADLSKKAPDNSRLTLFGETVILTLPAADDAAREKWFTAIQTRSTNLFVALTNRPVGMSLTFLASTETVASNIVEELEAYFGTTAEMALVPPWSPKAATPAFQTALANRRAWTAIGAQLGNTWEHPAVRSNNLQLAAASRRGATDEVKRLSKESETLTERLTKEARDRVRKSPPPSADTALLEQYFRMQDLSWTNRAERIAFFRELAPRLGQVPHDGNKPTRAALAHSATFGIVMQHGLMVEIQWMGFHDPTEGAPALLDWLCAKGCRQLKYDFEGSGLLGGLMDAEEEEE